MLASVLALTLAAAPHPYTVQDQVRLQRLLAVEPSPDGSRVALVIRGTDDEATRGLVDLWLINADGSNFRKLTNHAGPDSDPAWAPDGKSLFFLSARGNTQQVFRLPLDGGGEPVEVTKSPLDVNAFNLSRDGNFLVFAADVFADCDGDVLACTQKRLDEKAKGKTTGRVYDSLLFRHWDTWSDGRKSHLFVVPVAGGAPVDVTKKLKADAPSKPFGGSEEFTFTPDGKQVVFTARDVGREEAWSTDLDLFVVAADGKTAAKKLTTTNRATDTTPVFSPDGKSLAYLAMSRPGFESDKQSVIIRDWDKGTEKNLTAAWDRSADTLEWAPDGKSVVVTAWDVGQAGLFSIDVATGAVTTLLSDGHVSSPRPVGNTVWFSHDSIKSPAELNAIELGVTGAKPRKVTKINDEALKQVKLGEPEQFSFAGWNGEKVYGYLVKPIDFDAKKKYPLAFLIHGGPQGSFGNDWHYRWNTQVYAAAGFAVVMIDFHGSTGYGQKFTDSISGDWGGKPFEDLMKGLDAAVEKYPFIEKSRACALGASYGGYMINWIAGNAPDTFKCLVNHDGNLDERMAYYDTEELWFPEWEHGGLPWEKPEGYLKHNPIDFVAKWKTPMLVVHSGKDFRVVDTQGMATFTALQRKNIPSKFLYFPDENHWVLKPQNSILWHDTVLGWLKQWTAKK